MDRRNVAGQHWQVFKHGAHETLRRAIYCTNYRVFPDERLDTQVGSLQPVAGVHGLGALTCEIIERSRRELAT